jgi:hypothetical protein
MSHPELVSGSVGYWHKPRPKDAGGSKQQACGCASAYVSIALTRFLPWFLSLSTGKEMNSHG